MEIGLAIWAGEYIYHNYLEDHPKPPRPPYLVVPRTDAGAIVPLVYGTCRVRTPIMAWSGNYYVPGDAIPVAGSGSAYNTSHYSFDAIFIVGIGFERGTTTLVAMTAGDSALAIDVRTAIGGAVPFTAGTVYDAFAIEATHPDKFVIGGVFYASLGHDVLDNVSSPCAIVTSVPIVERYIDGIPYGATGNANEVPSCKTALRHASENLAQIPGYREQIAAFAHIKVGVTPNVPGIGFEIASSSVGSESEINPGSSDWVSYSEADPAAVIYDLFTARLGKLNLPTTMIDLPSFRAASSTLFAEGNGYSIVIDQPRSLVDILAEIMRQTDGVYYQDPTTGKIVYRLVRRDYNIGDVPNINPSNIVERAAGWYSVQGPAELPNQVIVRYTNRLDGYNNGTAPAQDSAGIIANGGRLRSVTVDMPGVCTFALAQKLASRELAVRGQALAKATVTVDRTFYGARVGDVYTLTDPELGIERMAMRVARVNRGHQGSSGLVLDMIRDVFDVSLGAFPAP